MGKLIAVEGIDGSGKTTVLSKVAKELRKRGYTVKECQEPGTTPMGKLIRSIIKADVNRSKIAEVLLYEASRADMIETVVKPALNTYDFVLLDRYIDSTIAYQGYGNGNDLTLIDTLNLIATQGIIPHKRFLIDVDLETAFNRRNLRTLTSDSKDPFDNNDEFAQKVYHGYQQLVQKGTLLAIPNKTLSTTVSTIIDYLV